MEVYYPADHYVAAGRTAVALGIFDGVHLGHTELLKKTIPQKFGPEPLVWTFEEHPDNLLAGRLITPLIMTNEEKCRTMAELGIRTVVFEDFRQVCDMSPREFVRDILTDRLRASKVVCGFNFRFGKGGAGDAFMLSELCSGYAIRVEVVPAVTLGGLAISSTHVRSMLQRGDMEGAAKMLGRRWYLHTEVVGGKRLGRTIGVPTINQNFPENHIIPAYGVYVCAAHVNGRVYPAVANIGIRPTLGDYYINAETHIIGFDGDLYGQKIKVEFFTMLRQEVKFPDLEALKGQIRKDIQKTEDYFKEHHISF